MEAKSTPQPATPLPLQPKDQKEMRAQVLALAWPVMAEMALGTITQMVDMAMVGRLGSAAIAAIGLSMQPFSLFMTIFSAISVGSTALVARFIGAKDKDNAAHALGQSLLVAMTLAALLSVISYIWAGPIIGIMRPEDDVLEIGVGYIRFLAPGFFFMLSGMMASGALRGAGDTKTPMKINIMVNLLNPVLNYLFIFGHLGFPALGVNGAALATTLARSIGGLTFLYFLTSGKTPLLLTRNNINHIDWPMLQRIFRVGIPAAIENLVIRTGQMLYARTVSGLGTVYYAAHAIATNAESISYMPGFSFAAAATSLVGRNLGANDPETAKESGYTAWRMGCLFMGTMAVVLFLFPGMLMRIYTDEIEVIEAGIVCLRITALTQVPMATSFIFSGALRGAGDTRFMLYVSALGTWVIRLGLSQVFVKHWQWGLAGA